MLSLNILEIQTNKETVEVFKTAYLDKNKLAQYREQFPNYHFYYFDKTIYCWKLENIADGLPSEFENIEISKIEHTLVFKEIIESSIISFFRRKGYDVFQRKYSSIWKMKLPNEKPVYFTGLSLIPFMEFQIDPLFSTQERKPVITISIRKTYKPVFTYNENDFAKQNIDIRNWDRNRKNEIIFSPKNKSKFLESTRQTEIYTETLNSLYNLKNEFKSFIALKKGFDANKSNLFLPGGLIVSDFYFSGLPNLYFKDLTILKPNYFFHNSRTGRGYYNKQLKELRPYSFNNFKSRYIKIAVFTPAKNEGTAGSFIKHLTENLRDTFHLQNIEFVLIKFDRNTSLDFIKDLVNKADEGNFHLAITILSQEDKKLPIKSSPYYILKAKLLGRKIPTQQVLIETLRKIRPSNDLVLNAISLNIYSKLGGTAWTIEKDEKERIEIVIGIGSSINFDKERIIGFANVFDYKGFYLIGSTSQISTYSNYSKNLETHLIKTIEQQIEFKSIDKLENFRLIFHLSKPASKKYEIKAIENALKYYHDYNIQYAIVHLSYQHNYRFFNDNGSGSITRGSYVELASRQALLHLGQNSKTPVLLRLDKRSVYEDTESMYKDLYAVAKQVLYFSHLSFKSFKPANIPVTIKYPQLMSKLSSELTQIDDWDRSNLEVIKDKLWFI